jgi:hypothetical protein
LRIWVRRVRVCVTRLSFWMSESVSNWYCEMTDGMISVLISWQYHGGIVHDQSIILFYELYYCGIGMQENRVVLGTRSVYTPIWVG